MKTIPFEFHVSKQIRNQYQFPDYFFATNGRVIFQNLNAVREFASILNTKRDLTNHPELAVKAGDINAMGLIDEIMHTVFSEYRRLENPGISSEALQWIENEFGTSQVSSLIEEFIEEFPPYDVYTGKQTVNEYLLGESIDANGIKLSNREIVLEELIIFSITNRNPAVGALRELFDDTNLRSTTIYPRLQESIQSFFSTQSFSGLNTNNLINFLLSPIIAVPGSLMGQLEFIRNNWGNLIPEYTLRLLTGLDLIREEIRPYFPPGPGPVQIPEFFPTDSDSSRFEPYPEYERFSPDTDWMPRLVLLAKNVYVWLDQLSKKYKLSIRSLDQVPDEELSVLAGWGFTGIWLIGIWERSRASQMIKQMCGNPEAVASAYSIFNYEIATDLGGVEAFDQLRSRARDFGIRIASDMVPNHMGIDSMWVVNHPDWFISLEQSPFPTYSFHGKNLSWDERVGIYLEDHYYNNTDAAVVFQRIDHWTGDTRYIYHGNDGTSMPWNDTAQLNYLIPEVREAVIQTILDVARKFPIIRFDAAMTLAKQHYHRLWFPEPGSGGDIPSRAGLGLSKEEFDSVFPEEFWREVVDRVAQEVPDTLLLAEAFWLMEGYFVRTLGMHRVYNSAFMNLLRDEKNQEYRKVIKNTLEFDPEILKRYVNFMNNPDEKTAVEQFGKGEKYFGICTLLVTMPGLPMVGHGQLEGFTEKYGMEYRKAYWDEEVDTELIQNHERLIFPLIRNRSLFADSERFYLFDFYTDEGYVDEDVFAYTNGNETQTVMVIYHNRFKYTSGKLISSAVFPQVIDGEKLKVSKNLSDVLHIPDNPDAYLVFRDFYTNLDFLVPCIEVIQNGFSLKLNPYHCHVFVNFHVVYDGQETPYQLLYQQFHKQGFENIEFALKELVYQEILISFNLLINQEIFENLIELQTKSIAIEERNHFLEQFETNLKSFLIQSIEFIHTKPGDQLPEIDINSIAQDTRNNLEILLNIPVIINDMVIDKDKRSRFAINYFMDGSGELSSVKYGNPKFWVTIYAYLIIDALGHLFGEEVAQQYSLNWMGNWMLDRKILEGLRKVGIADWNARRCILIIRMMFKWNQDSIKSSQLEVESMNWIRTVVNSEESRLFLNVNSYEGTTWFNKENYEELVWWWYSTSFILRIIRSESLEISDLTSAYQVVMNLNQIKIQSNYQVNNLGMIDTGQGSS